MTSYLTLPLPEESQAWEACKEESHEPSLVSTDFTPQSQPVAGGSPGQFFLFPLLILPFGFIPSYCFMSVDVFLTKPLNKTIGPSFILRRRTWPPNMQTPSCRHTHTK